MTFRSSYLMMSLAAVLTAGCSIIENPGNGDARPVPMLPDSSIFACDPAGDDDQNCLSNAQEGCGQDPEPDRDADDIPDYLDFDTDGDNIRDEVEIGSDCASPRDTDSDGAPDYLDIDSDNDGALDIYEDRNGDGMLGECAGECMETADCTSAEVDAGVQDPADIDPRTILRCSLPMDGVGPGTCISLACLDGESDFRNPDSDGDGVVDGLEGTFVCNPSTEDNPGGLKPIKYTDSEDTLYPGGNWRIALDPSAIELQPTLGSPGLLGSAYAFDYPDPNIEVAGFLVTRPALFASAVDESQAAIGRVSGSRVVLNGGRVSIRVSGTPTVSLDGFDTVVSTMLEVDTAIPYDVTELREVLLPELQGGSAFLPAPMWTGEEATQFIVLMQTVFRLETGQTVHMGSIARRAAYDDTSRLTGVFADDLANGTGHSISGNGEATECDQFVADRNSNADIIWIIDESGSTNDERANIAAAANQFFTQALLAGLDFRMGVTDMDDTGPGGQPGIFAARQAGPGTGDRWLQPYQLQEFIDGINDPSGPNPGDGGNEHGLTQALAAINRHLPRNSRDPQKIREGAQLVIIYVTDEKPDEVEDLTSMGEGNRQPNAQQEAEIAQVIAPYINHLRANGAVAHLISEPLPFKTSPCAGYEHAYGYYEVVNATGGQMTSICQLDFRPTVTAIIDDIVGRASPLTLSAYPISASITVARDNALVPRSRQIGWDYRGASNSLVFFALPFNPENPAEVVVSYRRWENQSGLD